MSRESGAVGGLEFRTSIPTFVLVTGGFGPHHTVHLGTVLNHLEGMHVDEIAARPSAHHDGSEVHADVIVQGPMVGGGIGTEWTIGQVHPDRGGNFIHDVSF